VAVTCLSRARAWRIGEIERARLGPGAGGRAWLEVAAAHGRFFFLQKKGIREKGGGIELWVRACVGVDVGGLGAGVGDRRMRRLTHVILAVGSE
jgi:hypothetical protein